MAAQKPIAGTAYFTIDGKQYSLGAKASVKSQEVIREPKMGLSGDVHFTEKPAIQSITVEFMLADGLTAQDLNKVDDGTIVLESVNGTTYTIRNGKQTGEIEEDLAEGTAEATFTGKIETMRSRA